MYIAAYDYETIHRIVNSVPVVHCSFPASLEPNSDPFPAILPLIGVMASYSSPESIKLDEPLDLYLHGYVSSRFNRFVKKTGAEGDEDDIENGLPISVAATQVHGVILSLAPNGHSYNYSSAVLQGYATPVTDEAEKLWAVEVILNSVVPNRWANTRFPPAKAEMTATQIVKVKIVSASAKLRRGGPHNEKRDLSDEETRAKFWTGTLPVWQTIGSPVPGDENMLEEVPEHLTEYVKSANERAEKEAMDAMKEPSS